LVSHVNATVDVIYRAKAEKLLMDKMERVLDGSDPYGLTLDSWDTLFNPDRPNKTTTPKPGPPAAGAFPPPQPKPNTAVHPSTNDQATSEHKSAKGETTGTSLDGGLPGAKRRKIDELERNYSLSATESHMSMQKATKPPEDAGPLFGATPINARSTSFAEYKSLAHFEENPSQIALPVPVGLDDDDDRPILSSKGSNFSANSASKLDIMDDGISGSLVDYPDSSDPSQRVASDLMSQ
jgi:hypothetical protein